MYLRVCMLCICVCVFKFVCDREIERERVKIWDSSKSHLGTNLFFTLCIQIFPPSLSSQIIFASIKRKKQAPTSVAINTIATIANVVIFIIAIIVLPLTTQLTNSTHNSTHNLARLGSARLIFKLTQLPWPLLIWAMS